VNGRRTASDTSTISNNPLSTASLTPMIDQSGDSSMA